MVHRLDFDLGLHRLAAAADGGGSGDYSALSGLFRICSVCRTSSNADLHFRVRGGTPWICPPEITP